MVHVICIEQINGVQLILETSSFEYLGIIIRSDLNWVDHENYTLRKTWQALHS
jgi:hypothetical protein